MPANPWRRSTALTLNSARRTMPVFSASCSLLRPMCFTKPVRAFAPGLKAAGNTSMSRDEAFG